MASEKKIPWSTAIREAVIITIIACILVFLGFPNEFFAFARSGAFQKACFSNIRVITGAIETYNLENSKKIEELNDNNLKLLVEKGNLKSIPEAVYNECKYMSSGNLSKDGFVYCDMHGDPGKKIDVSFKEEQRENEQSKKRNRFIFQRLLLLIAICLGPGLFRLFVFWILKLFKKV